MRIRPRMARFGQTAQMAPSNDLSRAPIIEREVLDRLLSDLAAGKYHLVLGAGASAGVVNRSGPLPMARELTEILLDEIDGAPSAAGVTLQRAFARAVATTGKESVEGLLRQRFADCTPCNWQMNCPLIPWEAVWTLNIDDSIEQAYESVTKRTQRALIRLWQDRASPLGGVTEHVPIVHLHGYVGEIDRRDDPQLVFSLAQYLSALRQADASNWQTRFRGEYETAPVIIIGAQLHDEIDLAGVIQSGNAASEFGSPSLIVRPGLTQFDRDEYKEWGLVPVDATADEFMDLLASALESRNASISSEGYRTRYTEATFLELGGRKADFPRLPGSDFYGGHEPEWLDILENLDATPRWVTGLADEIGTPESFPNVQRLYYLSGSPFSGKSTALLRLARELYRKGWRPVYLAGKEKLDTGEALKYFESKPAALLLVDGLRIDVPEVARLLEQADAVGQRLIIIATDRLDSHNHTKRVVSSRFLVGLNPQIFIEPTNGLWISVLLRRTKAGRLGRLEGKPRAEWSLHFSENRHDLYSSLATLEDANGFIDRGVAALGEIETRLRTAFVAIGVFAVIGLEAPMSTIAAVAGIPMNRLLPACRVGGEIAEWVVYDAASTGFIQLRHGYLGELILRPDTRRVHEVDLPILVHDVLLSISDRVGPEGIYRKDYYYRAASQLMGLSFVQRIVGTDDVDAWYESLAPYYEWNARFWEQRALGLPNELAKAYSYAKRATSKHEDAFSFNTLGTVLMRRAVHRSTPDSNRHGYWSEANDALVASREDGKGRFELPYLTFFDHTRYIVERLEGVAPSWEADMQAAVGEWITEAERVGLASDNDVLDAVAKYPPEWIGAARSLIAAREKARKARKAARRKGRGNGPATRTPN